MLKVNMFVSFFLITQYVLSLCLVRIINQYISLKNVNGYRKVLKEMRNRLIFRLLTHLHHYIYYIGNHCMW